MPDITIPDAAVEAALRARFLPNGGDPIGGWEKWATDQVRAQLTAAAPHIAAQALRDVASVWQRVSDPEFARSARRLLNVANRIEPDHG